MSSRFAMAIITASTAAGAAIPLSASIIFEDKKELKDIPKGAAVGFMYGSVAGIFFMFADGC